MFIIQAYELRNIDGIIRDIFKQIHFKAHIYYFVVLHSCNTVLLTNRIFKQVPQPRVFPNFTILEYYNISFFSCMMTLKSQENFKYIYGLHNICFGFDNLN